MYEFIGCIREYDDHQITNFFIDIFFIIPKKIDSYHILIISELLSLENNDSLKIYDICYKIMPDIGFYLLEI